MSPSDDPRATPPEGTGRVTPERARSRATVLAGFLVIQSGAAVFFVADAVADFTFEGLSAHHVFEATIALALVVGVVLGALETRRLLDRARRGEAALAAASGALGEVIEAYFEEWALTPAEAEVAMLAMKGFDVAEIASFRGAAKGTVRAQLTKVYAKAGVSNRAQLVSILVEDLLDLPDSTPGK